MMKAALKNRAGWFALLVLSQSCNKTAPQNSSQLRIDFGRQVQASALTTREPFEHMAVGIVPRATDYKVDKTWQIHANASTAAVTPAAQFYGNLSAQLTTIDLKVPSGDNRDIIWVGYDGDANAARVKYMGYAFGANLVKGPAVNNVEMDVYPAGNLTLRAALPAAVTAPERQLILETLKNKQRRLGCLANIKRTDLVEGQPLFDTQTFIEFEGAEAAAVSADIPLFARNTVALPKGEYQITCQLDVEKYGRLTLNNFTAVAQIQQGEQTLLDLTLVKKPLPTDAGPDLIDPDPEPANVGAFRIYTVNAQNNLRANIGSSGTLVIEAVHINHPTIPNGTIDTGFSGEVLVRLGLVGEGGKFVEFASDAAPRSLVSWVEGGQSIVKVNFASTDLGVKRLGITTDQKYVLAAARANTTVLKGYRSGMWVFSMVDQGVCTAATQNETHAMTYVEDGALLVKQKPNNGDKVAVLRDMVISLLTLRDGSRVEHCVQDQKISDNGQVAIAFSRNEDQDWAKISTPAPVVPPDWIVSDALKPNFQLILLPESKLRNGQILLVNILKATDPAYRLTSNKLIQLSTLYTPTLNPNGLTPADLSSLSALKSDLVIRVQ